jgi:hypothetical protein
MTKDCYPDQFTKVHFRAATGFISKGYIREESVSDRTSKHGGMVAILDDGYIIVDQAWGRRPQEKPKLLSKEELDALRRKRK